MNGICRAAGVSRAGYYRFLLRVQPQESAMDLRSQIQQIALRWPAYGYRRVHAELLRQGWTVNHKRILRWMRADNLLCLRRRKFLLTTDSQHGLPIDPNVAEGMVLTGIDQLWVADINLRPLASGVRVFGDSAGCLFATLHRLGTAAQFGSSTGP